MEEPVLFEARQADFSPGRGRTSVEKRLDDLADLANEATQLATKIRTNLNTLTQNARSGNVGTAEVQIQRVTDEIVNLSAKAEQLVLVERSLGIRGEELRVSEYANEVQAELAKKGLTPTKGPDPYWLVYPAWFTIGYNAKGALEVVLNGDRLETVRPTEVATKVADAVNEKFQPKQFAKLLLSVRNLLRRAGADNSTLALDDIYEVLALDAGNRGTRNRDFTRALFYYSVHRLAEDLEQSTAPAMDFPAANRSNFIFFTKDGDGRKYLTVDFGSQR